MECPGGAASALWIIKSRSTKDDYCGKKISKCFIQVIALWIIYVWFWYCNDWLRRFPYTFEFWHKGPPHLGFVWFVLCIDPGILHSHSFKIPMSGWSFGKESKIPRNGEFRTSIPIFNGGGKLRGILGILSFLFSFWQNYPYFQQIIKQFSFVLQ